MNIFPVLYLLGALAGVASLFIPDSKTILLPPIINDSITIENIEVTVGDWMVYSNFIQAEKSKKSFASILPDSSCVDQEIWNLFKCPCTFKSSLRFTSKSEKEMMNLVKQCVAKHLKIKRKKELDFFEIFNFPITGVSYEQALDYCKWRTEINQNKNFVYRLPTEEEWRLFCRKGMLPHEQEKGLMDSTTKNKCNCALFNYKIVDCVDENTKNTSNKLKKIGYYFSNLTGLFDVFGNVSEMTMTKGVSKGGNYSIFASQAHVDSIQFYTKPEKWLGFRCVKDF
jgi:formylglycine-generating enzyme required for sulfatase activity